MQNADIKQPNREKTRQVSSEDKHVLGKNQVLQ